MNVFWPENLCPQWKTLEQLHLYYWDLYSIKSVCVERETKRRQIMKLIYIKCSDMFTQIYAILSAIQSSEVSLREFISAGLYAIFS